MTDAINVTDLSEAELANLLRGRAGNKYRNRKVEYEGETFDSQWELTRWLELKALERAGEISILLRQKWVTVLPAFEYEGQRIRAVRLRVDFVYDIGVGGSWRHVYEDAKGIVTPAYAIKWKLLQHMYRDNPSVILRLSYK